MVDRPPQPADGDSTKTQLRRLVRRLAGVGLLAFGLVVVFLLALLWFPRWRYPLLTEADLQGVSDTAKVQELKGARLKLQNDASTTLLQGLGAVLVLTGAAIGANVALRQVRATRDQITETATASRNQLKLSYDQLELSQQGQVTDRYTKAIDQLDDNKALAVRLGGLYALERIARDSRDDRATIAEVLCAYARTAPREPLARPAQDAAPPVTDPAPAGTSAAEPASLTVRAPDVQAALTILGRWRERLGEPPPVLDLHSADLRGARLFGAQLQGAILDGAQLQGALLVFVKLQGARFFAAQLQGARFFTARLQEASFSGAQLQGAFLDGAQLQGAILNGAQLQGASLVAAQLKDAYLFDAQLQGALLDRAELQGVKASEGTRWPEGWDHARARAAGVHFVTPPSLARWNAPRPDEPAPPGEEYP